MLVAGCGFLVVALVMQEIESNNGEAWCEQQDGENISDTTSVICIGPDDKLLKAPTDKDGDWP